MIAYESVQRLRRQLELEEGKKHKPYLDTKGKLTIGVGRNLTDRGLNETEVQLLLTNDLAMVHVELSERLPWFAFLDDVRQAVLWDMAFNMGVPRLLGFKKSLAAAEAREWDAAADEMIDSKWAREDVGPLRSGRLAQMMRTGEWPEEALPAVPEPEPT